jgi:phosphoserine phosphatase
MQVFFGSSRESAQCMEQVASWLQAKGVEVLLWTDAKAFPAGHYTLERLIELARTVDSAVFIFGEDDKVWYRDSEQKQPRDNVLLEYGLFAARLGLKRCIVCQVGEAKICADAYGLTTIRYSQKNWLEAKNRFEDWLTRCLDSPATGKPGLFLDVDNTLTNGFIQEQFARLLGAHAEYQQLEDQYQRDQISSAMFGNKIINLFNERGFNKKFAEDNYSKIEQANWADTLLSLADRVTIYLVSSGPSYYILPFGVEHGIAPSNILCSQYSFDTSGKLANCKSVNDDTKASFVRKHKGKHSITVGVGDQPKKDGLFISNCDISILTAKDPNFLYVDSLEVVNRLMEKLCRRL